MQANKWKSLFECISFVPKVKQYRELSSCLIRVAHLLFELSCLQSVRTFLHLLSKEKTLKRRKRTYSIIVRLHEYCSFLVIGHSSSRVWQEGRSFIYVVFIPSSLNPLTNSAIFFRVCTPEWASQSERLWTKAWAHSFHAFPFLFDK